MIVNHVSYLYFLAAYTSFLAAKYFCKNAPKFISQKNIFMNKPHGQEKGVAWQHFCKINFYKKAEKRENL